MSATKELAAAEFKPTRSSADPHRPSNLPESAAKLERLPEGLQFPESMQSRIRFDLRRRRLLYYGFMSKGDYDRLRGLSTDGSYLAALDQLFRDSSSHVIAIDIGRDQVLELELDPRVDSHPIRTTVRRWALQWVLLLTCFLGSAALVLWWLSKLL